MIVSFRCAETERIFGGEPSRRFPPDLQRTARRKLRLLDAAATPTDLRATPGNRLEALKGDRQGQHSIRVNERWRLCSRWTEAGPDAVEMVDCH